MISIVIPVYNQWDMTKQCLESIVRHSGNVDYEIIIIDNGSTPPVREQYFNGYDNIIRNETNLGFPKAVNQGIRAAKGDIICLLNNDTVVTHGWLERLTARLDEYDIVSPMTNYVAGLQKAITATYDDEASLNHAAIEWTKQNDGVTQEVNFVIGFCMVFRKALFNDIGDFDESMFPCSGEEIDFCYDKETQIVTKDGIKFFYELTLEDEIITKNDAGIIEFQNPTEVISRYEKTLLHFNSKSVDIKCSKKQNLLVGYYRKEYDYKVGSEKPVEFITAEKINDKLYKNQSRFYIENASGIWQGVQKENINIAGHTFGTRAYVEFMAWYLSEGSVDCDLDRRKRKGNNQIIVSQFDKDNSASIYKTVCDLGFKANLSKAGVSFSDKQFCDYLSLLGKSWNKFIPDEIKELSSEMLELFLHTYAKGDGNFAKSCSRTTWYTSSDRMKDGLIELLIKTQKPFTVGMYGGGDTAFSNGVYNCRQVWSIQSCTGTDVNNKGRVSLKKADEVEYNDFTYDVRVPNKRIYIIRNGKGCWTSNCMKARKSGHHVGIVKDVYIHHYGSQTFMEMQQSGVIDYKKVCVECDKNIEKKWANRFLKSFWQEQGNIERFNDIKDDDDGEGERLNLGCGRYPLEGFINLDKSENVNPDIVCDVLKLHYSNESIEEIYCGHLLEHMTLEEGIEALAYWKSLLKKGGKITITVPDFDVLARKYLDNPTPEKLIELNNVYIYSYCQESKHKYCYSGELLKSLMVKAGFVEIQKLPLNHHYFVDPVDWQVAYEGRKA